MGGRCKEDDGQSQLFGNVFEVVVLITAGEHELDATELN